MEEDYTMMGPPAQPQYSQQHHPQQPQHQHQQSGSCVSLHKYIQHSSANQPTASSTAQVPISYHDDSNYCTWPTAATPAAAFPGFAPAQWELAPDGLPGHLGLEAHGLPTQDMGPTYAPYQGFSPNSADFLGAEPTSLHGSFSSTVASDMMGSLAIGENLNQSGSWSLPAGHVDDAVPGHTTCFSSQPHPGLVGAAPSAQAGYAPHTAHTFQPLTPRQGGQRQHHLRRREKTVSPKLLRINPSPTPQSSSESSHNNYLAESSESDGGPALAPRQPPAPTTTQEPKAPKRGRAAGTRGTRKQLPSRAPNHHRFVSIRPGRGSSRMAGTSPPSASLSSSSGSGVEAAPASSQTKAGQATGSRQPKVASSKNSGKGKVASTAAVVVKQPELSPPAPVPASLTSTGDSGAGSTGATEALPGPMRERSLKDDFLVRNKLAGMKYKDIRRKGGFSEAESTLRGRFRTLTKHRDARVRKPEWTDNDIMLLQQAVRTLAEGSDITTAKIPWKKVAEYIFENGGTYLFGNSTCRKKWDDLVAKGQTGVKDSEGK